MARSDYQLHLGDCLEIMPTLETGSIDAIIADWPYGTTACKWDSVIPFEPLWKECKRVIKPNGAIVLFGSQPFTSMLVMSNLEWFKWEDIWDKKLSTGFLNSKIMPLRRHENILVFGSSKITYHPQMRKGKLRKKDFSSNSNCYGIYHNVTTFNDDYYPTSIIEIHNANQTEKEHNTQKPVALLEYLIKTYTNPGELVLDNTFGSCTTGEACLRTGRRFVGIEKDPDYFRIGQERMERVAAELRGEFIPKPAKGKVEDLPMFSEAINGAV